MMGARTGPVCQHTQLLVLDTPQSRTAQRDLPILLHLGSEASRRWPEGVVHAEDAVYRFVARLLAPASEPGEAGAPQRQARERLAVDLAWAPASCRAPCCTTGASRASPG